MQVILHSAILSTCIKLPPVSNTFILSIFEWSLKTGLILQVEKQRGELNRELEDLAIRLDEAGGATSAQIDLNKKREQELIKLRRDLDEQALQSESQIASLRKKAQDVANEMSDQIEQLQKAKSK